MLWSLKKSCEENLKTLLYLYFNIHCYGFRLWEGKGREGSTSKQQDWKYIIVLILQVKALTQIIFRKPNVIPQGKMQLYYICWKIAQIPAIFQKEEFSEAVMLKETYNSRREKIRHACNLRWQNRVEKQKQENNGIVEFRNRNCNKGLLVVIQCKPPGTLHSVLNISASKIHQQT